MNYMYDLTPNVNRSNRLPCNPFEFFEQLENFFFGNISFPEFKNDITDKGSYYLFEAELPGLNKDDIRIDINENRLTINAVRKNEFQQNEQNGHFAFREYSQSAYVRSFDVSGVDISAIHAEYSGGVLRLKMPKSPQFSRPAQKLKIE